MNIEELKRELADDVSIVELNADPYPEFERLRRDKPLAWAGNLNMWLVTRFDDVAHVLDHPELFTAETEPSFLADVLGVNMLTLEGDAARRIKDPMLPPFTARGCSKQYIDEELEAFANKLIDRFADKGEVELMSAYAEPIATHSLKTVLGLDGVSDAKMWELCQGVCAGLANFEGDPAIDAVYRPARAAIEELVQRKIEQVHKKPDGSAISTYVNGGYGLAEQEVINNVRLMISGGINEPRDGIGMAVYAYLTHSDQVAGHEPDRRFWLRFIGEVLRLYSPVGTAARMTTRRTELCDTILPKGEFISACLAAANRDPDAWELPDQFDLARNTQKHLAFSRGQHRCLGLWLGLNEIIVGASTLLKRLPNAHLVPAKPVEISGFEFRGPKTMHLSW